MALSTSLLYGYETAMDALSQATLTFSHKNLTLDISEQIARQNAQSQHWGYDCEDPTSLNWGARDR